MWGFSGCCAQLLTQDYGMSSLFLTMARMPISTVIFGIILAFTARDKVRLMLADRQTRKGLVVFGCVGLFSCQLTYIVAIAYTNAGTGTVLEQLSIVIIMLVACLLAKKLPNIYEVVGLVCAFAAVVLISTKGDFSTLAIGVEGLAWGIGAALATTMYVMYPKRLFDRWGSFAVTGLGTAAGACLCITIALASFVWCAVDPTGTQWLQDMWTIPTMDAAGWAAFGVTTLVGTFLAFALYLRGVHIVGQIRGSQLGAAEPASAAIFAAVWLGTPFVWADWLGLVLMIATIFLMSRAEGK